MKKLFAILASCIFIVLSTYAVSADDAYKSYYQGHWTDVLPGPNTFEPSTEINGSTLGIQPIVSPSDMMVSDNTLYILDSGNNRILILNSKYKLIKTIGSFKNKGKDDNLNNPSGIYVKNSTIYVADTDNNRIVILSLDGKLVNIIRDIKSSTLASDFIFLPQKIGVDNAGRIYVVAKNVFQGLMMFSAKGDFTGYFGTINVTFSPIDMFWRTMATKAQKAQMQLFIPTEFTNLDVDKDGFIYTTEVSRSDSASSNIKKLNPSGNDVLVNYTDYPINGDSSYEYGVDANEGPSNFVDVCIGSSQMYYCLDSTRGRVFVYDSEGDNVTVFGVNGNQVGAFSTPVAVDTINDNVLVLDKTRGTVTVFAPTQLGSTINSAINYNYDGNIDKSVIEWNKVIKLDANYELAYKGIGKSYLSAGDNKLAMQYLKKGYDKKNYSIAFKRYRNEWLKHNANAIILTIALVVIALILNKHLLQPMLKNAKKLKNNWGKKHERIFGTSVSYVISPIRWLLQYEIRT